MTSPKRKTSTHVCQQHGHPPKQRNHRKLHGVQIQRSQTSASVEQPATMMGSGAPPEVFGDLQSLNILSSFLLGITIYHIPWKSNHHFFMGCFTNIPVFLIVRVYHHPSCFSG